MIQRIAIPLCLFAFTVPATAQQCHPDVRLSAPLSRFTINADETVTDLWTGLIWQRCPLGTSLDTRGTTTPADDICSVSGVHEYDWGGALQAAQNLNDGGGFAGAVNWRLPNVKELMSITEQACIAPAINQLVFPNVAMDNNQGMLFSQSQWTSTPTGSSSNTHYSSRTVSLYSGRFNYDGVEKTNGVRLVRDP